MSGSHRSGAIATLAAGAWRGATQDTDGEPIWSQYCVLTRPQIGQVRVTLEQPCTEANFCAGFCWQGASPVSTRYSLEHVSDTVKLFHFDGGDGAVDPKDFSFEFLKGAN